MHVSLGEENQIVFSLVGGCEKILGALNTACLGLSTAPLTLKLALWNNISVI